VRESLTSEDVAEINTKTQALQTAFHKVSEQMYAAAQAQQEAAGGTGAADGDGANGAAAEGSVDDEEVVDAEVVDDKEQ